MGIASRGNILVVVRLCTHGTVARMRSRLEIEAGAAGRAAIDRALGRFGAGALRIAAAIGTRVVLLRTDEGFSDRSPVLRRLACPVDAWPSPPAGLFVVEERTVYLRSTSLMTVAHEFAHALDCALGGGVYLSGANPRVRKAFGDAKRFVTPYAATGLDEYFAESARAWVEANDPHSAWPQATRARLRSADPAMAEIIAEIFRGLER